MDERVNLPTDETWGKLEIMFQGTHYVNSFSVHNMALPNQVILSMHLVQLSGKGNSDSSHSQRLTPNHDFPNSTDFQKDL